MLGITPDTASVELHNRELVARFGPWGVRTSIDNVIGWSITGPYRAWKAIGAHVSLRDRGLTFGTNAARGICLRFRRPVAGAEPLGLLRHPGLTLTLESPDRLGRLLDELRGQPAAGRGRDERRGA